MARTQGGRQIRRRRTSTAKWLAAFGAVILLAGCGLRVPGQTVKAATAAATNGGSGGGTRAAASATGVGSAPGAADTGAATPTGPGAVTGPSAAATGPTTPTSAAPAGGNGGATDVGVTADTITVGNVSDLGGPVPGLFQGGPYGTQAYFNYINSQGGVFGRKLKLVTADDQLQCSNNEAAYQNLSTKVFGFVGSWSLDDNCGAQILKQYPDMPNVSQQLSPEAAALPGSFSLAPFGQGAALGPMQYYKQKYPDAITKVGTIVGNQASAVAAWHYQKQALESLGYKVIYEDDFPPAQNNFTADVISMRNQGVKMVYIIAVNAPDVADFSAEAAQQGWKPEVFAAPVAYFGQYVQQSGGAANVEGQYVNVGAARFLGEDAATNPEVALFGKWIKVVNSSFAVDQFSAYSWANAAYFVKGLQAVGPHLTRKALLAALAGIHNYDDNGMMAPTDPGKKVPASCFDVLQLQGGKYVRVDDPPTGYRCDGGYYTYHG